MDYFWGQVVLGGEDISDVVVYVVFYEFGGYIVGLDVQLGGGKVVMGGDGGRE